MPILVVGLIAAVIGASPASATPVSRSGGAPATASPTASTQATAHDGDHVDGALTMEPMEPGVNGSLAAQDCTPGYDRTYACQNGGGWAQVRRGTGEVIGAATFNLNYKITLDIKQRVFVEHVKIHVTSASGVGITAGFESLCSSTCTADSHVPSGLLKPETTLKGVVAFSDSTKTKHTGAITHRMRFTAPGAIPGSAGAAFFLKFRCDDLLEGQSAGCVWPAYTPTITSLKGLRFISANIRRWQGRGAPKLSPGCGEGCPS
jgi:hypothetical protein